MEKSETFEMDIRDLQYPIGEYAPCDYSGELKNERISDIKDLPMMLGNALAGLNEEQLQTPYPKLGWTIHQVVHHLAERHMDGYIRFKFGYAQNESIIQPYDEKVKLKSTDPTYSDDSLSLLRSLHQKWACFMNEFTFLEFGKMVFYPGYNKEMSLWYLLGLYAWRGRHHVAHINQLRQRMNW